MKEVTTSLPPWIGDRTVPLDPPLAADLEAAVQEITTLDRAHGDDLAPLAAVLLRTESVASSKIEHVSASSDDYARALYGMKVNPSAVSMVAATRALDALMAAVDRGHRIDLQPILTAHRLLMEDAEGAYAGRLRDMQNWIGGSDHSPRGATYVPPPPETVATHMDDLLAFANRDDMPVLLQAAVVHAQFESIHPFTDGNGRIGRALVNAVLRRRETTTRVVVPLASALVAHRDRYFDHLDAYRRGDPRPITAAFALASRVAALESQRTATRLTSVPDEWRAAVDPLRAGSAAAKLLDLLPGSPIISASDACDAIDAPASSVYAALERLRAAGVIRPLTNRQREQVWGAGLILDELDDLTTRIERAAR